ncbi:MAG: GSU2403 family nucleotidyltransferase fold protein [Elusimicrobiota bacterium]
MKEKDAPVEFVVEVLRRLDKAGVLQDMILIGSWCVHFYKDHFEGAALSAIRTRDMDFLIPTPPKIKGETHILDILKGLDFVPDLHGDGSVSLGHPELIIDFLVAERGRGSDKPYLVKALGVKAQPLRFLSLLSDDTIEVRSRGLELVLPHPINFALQKLIISGRRAYEVKAVKDRIQAVEVLREVVSRGDGEKARSKFLKLPAGWRKAVLAGLKAAKADDLIDFLA